MTTVQIKEFQSLGNGYWRVNPHGKVTLPGLAGSEPRIWVSLTLLRNDYETPFKAQSLVQPEEHRELLIKIGLISLLTIGSVWKDGIRQTPRLPAKTRKYTDFRHSQFELVRFNQKLQINGKAFTLFGEGRYNVGQRAWNKMKDSWFAVARGFSNECGGGLLVIPSTVLFQACMATSPVMARRLLFGELNQILDEECSFVADEPGTLKVTAAKEIRSKEDAPAAANIMVDPVAGEAYKMMRQHIVAAQVNFMGHEQDLDGVNICLGVPFSRKFHLTVSGKPLAFQGADATNPAQVAWGFLVTEIHSLQVPLPFSKLVVERKNSGAQGANANDEDLIEAWPAAKPTAVKPTPPDQPVTSEGEPSSKIGEISAYITGSFTPLNLEVIHEPKLVQRYRSARLVKATGVDFENLATTGEPISSGGIASLGTKQTQAVNTPLALEQVLDAISILNDQGINIRTIAVGPISRTDDKSRTINYFTNPHRKGRSWRHIFGEDYLRTRGFVVGELYKGGVWHYLIDIEHKRPGELSMLCLYAEDGARIATRSLHIFMESVAQANGWRAQDHYTNLWRFQSIRHAQKNAKGLAEIIERHF